MSKRPRRQRGFTLIEVMVAASIIAVLMGLSVASLGAARQKAADGRVITDLAGLNSALANYYSRNRVYPDSLSQLTPTYIGTLPKNPFTQTDYPYQKDFQFAAASEAAMDTKNGAGAGTFIGDAKTISANLNWTGPDNTLGVYADPTNNASSCAYLHASGTNSNTYSYRLGSPLRTVQSEATRDATPCSNRFIDFLGEVVGP